MPSDISLKTNPSSIAAVHRRTTTQADVFENIPAGFATVLAVLKSANVDPVGPPATVFHVVPDGTVDGEIAMRVPVAVAVEGADDVETVVVPEHIVVSSVHEGSYETLGETYAAIATWIHDNGHTVSGPTTETYFNSPGEVAEEDLRTEVSFPIDGPSTSG